MGPRPLRPRLPVKTGAAQVQRLPAASTIPVPAVGAPSPRRAPTIPTAPLPADTRRALSGIVKQLRDVPRALIGDPAEVVHFLNRQARAIERVRDEPVPIALPAPKVAPTPIVAPPQPRTLTARETAEAAFRPPSTSSKITAASVAALPRPRIVADRKGRSIRVEVRRAREAGQMEMPV